MSSACNSQPSVHKGDWNLLNQVHTFFPQHLKTNDQQMIDQWGHPEGSVHLWNSSHGQFRHSIETTSHFDSSLWPLLFPSLPQVLNAKALPNESPTYSFLSQHWFLENPDCNKWYQKDPRKASSGMRFGSSLTHPQFVLEIPNLMRPAECLVRSTNEPAPNKVLMADVKSVRAWRRATICLPVFLLPEICCLGSCVIKASVQNISLDLRRAVIAEILLSYTRCAPSNVWKIVRTSQSTVD
ncbi:uncharacterized protein LOC123378999 [Felis catus]|uniref:uncharacterized protein LOC123378999 n=1 Tax=Felis catus TaxID=9685 RepID=UPI001D1A16C9|nr:uncharacterized protein LOC123378999 [Felis catus]